MVYVNAQDSQNWYHVIYIPQFHYSNSQFAVNRFPAVESHEYAYIPPRGRKANRFVRGSERSHTRHGISLLALSMDEPQDLNEAIICIDSPQENKLCQGSVH